jgi:hypothetical protein
MIARSTPRQRQDLAMLHTLAKDALAALNRNTRFYATEDVRQAYATVIDHTAMWSDWECTEVDRGDDD